MCEIKVTKETNRLLESVNEQRWDGQKPLESVITVLAQEAVGDEDESARETVLGWDDRQFDVGGQ